jgi:hypothetical protein
VPPSAGSRGCAVHPWGPPSFDTLLQERMVSDGRHLLTSLSDKSRIPLIARASNVSSARQFLVTSDCEAASQTPLPAEDYVLKATHTSGCVAVVVRGVMTVHKPCFGEASAVGRVVTPALLRSMCDGWLAHAYTDVKPRERAYKNVPRAVLVQELLPAPLADAAVADDLKCWTAGQRTLYVQHTRARFGDDGIDGGGTSKRDTFYDARTLRARPDITFRSGVWGERAALGMASHPDTNSTRWLAPRVVYAAARACERVASATSIDFARIDLLISTITPHRPDGLVLSEVSLYPFGGYPRLSPRSVDAELAEAWCAVGGPHWSAPAKIDDAALAGADEQTTARRLRLGGPVHARREWQWAPTV